MKISVLSGFMLILSVKYYSEGAIIIEPGKNRPPEKIISLLKKKSTPHEILKIENLVLEIF